MFNLNPLSSSQPPPRHRWQGRSGRWYDFWIYPLGNIPGWIRWCSCNYILARPRRDFAGPREPLYIGQKGDTDRFENHEKLGPALLFGATELHVCSTASSRWERVDIETDLRNAHQTPLNLQPSPAPSPANALCGIGLGMASAGSLLGAFGIPSPGPAPSYGGGIPSPASALHPRNALLDALEPQNHLSALFVRPPGA